MLLDEVGRLLAVAPAAPSLLGQDLTRRYELLRLGVAGQVTVSRAVLSVARRRPVVAFSVPYETPHGRRVFSGAYELATIPLADYLGRAVPTASATLYLVDPGGVVVASNRQLPEGLAGLGSLDLALRLPVRCRCTSRLTAPAAGSRGWCWSPSLAALLVVVQLSQHLGSRARGATVSIGVAAWDGQETADELVARADAALYAAKEGGRDRYLIA